MGTGSRGPVNFHLLTPPKMISPVVVLNSRPGDGRYLRRQWRVLTKSVLITAKPKTEYRRRDHLLRDHQVQDARVADGVGVGIAQPQDAREGVVAVVGDGELHAGDLEHCRGEARLVSW